LFNSVSTTEQVSRRSNASAVLTAVVEVRHQQVIGSTSTMSTGTWGLGLGAWANAAGLNMAIVSSDSSVFVITVNW
jgi:hypothetical protein